MPKNAFWIDNYPKESGSGTESYIDALVRTFPETKIETEKYAGEAYRSLQQQMRDIVVINPWLSPGENCPYEPPQGWKENYNIIGIDLAYKIRGIDGKVPIIFLGGRELIDISCPAASEIICALDVLPSQFTEIMRKYIP